ncbi:MAG: TonB-dependent receptor [Gammaproteobacteria bacterium]|nr:TonB-dependent receptor [Gammaproteobacteria bacterium]MDE0414550.1 TonB-dependent receptor [Gammaproteobacteria bacterium]
MALASSCRLALLLLLAQAALAQAAGEPNAEIALEGRLLRSVLADYEAAGYQFIYSRELVRPNTRLKAERDGADALEKLRASLRDIGLNLLPGHAAGVFRIARSSLAAAAEEPQAQGRTISGRVTDANTGQAVTGARVQAGAARATTDADGRFALDPGTAERIQVTHPGYVRQTAATAPDEPQSGLRIALEPRIEELLVTAERKALREQSQVSRHALDAAEIEAMPTFGDEALRATFNLPGVSSIGVGAMPHVRGGMRNETLVLFDGAVLVEPFHLEDFQGVFSVLDPQIIEELNLHTGGFPARYGNRMSGVLDIEAAAVPPGTGGSITFSFLNTGVFAHGGADRGAPRWLFSLRRGNLDVLTRRINPKVGLPNYADGYGRLEWELEGGRRLALAALIYNNDIEFVDSNSGIGEQADSHYYNAQTWLRYERDWPSGMETESLLSARIYRNHRYGEANFADPWAGGGAVNDRRNFRDLNFSHRAALQWGGVAAELGASLGYVQGEYEYAASTRSTALAAALGAQRHPRHAIRSSPRGLKGQAYGSARFKPRPRIAVEAGLRWDYQGYTSGTRRHQLNPRLSLGVELRTGTVLRLAAGVFSQAQEIHELQVEDGLDSFQHPQQAHHFVVSLMQRYSTLGLSVEIAAYRKNFRRPALRYENLFNPLVLLPEIAADRIAVEPSEARAAGVELTLRWEPSAQLQGWLSLAQSMAEDQLGGQWIKRHWNQSYALAAGAIWNGDSWSASAAMRVHPGWHSTRLPAAIAPGQRLDLQWNESRLRRFVSVDLRLSRSWDWESHALSVFIEAVNVLDRKNIGGIDYTLSASDSLAVYDVASEDVAVLPYAPSLGFRWRF